MEKNQLAVMNTSKEVGEPIKITNEDIKNLFCPLATEKEVALALGIVKGLNLNPFLREVFFIKYSAGDRMAIVVGYEVYIKRAERSGKLNGWKAGIKKDEGVAWVEIRRKDWVEPFYWEVNLNEFDKKQSTWKQIPSFMGKKVAIAQGFRLCFPDECGSMPYVPEEQEVYTIGEEPKQITSTKPVVAMPEEVVAEPVVEQQYDEKGEIATPPEELFGEPAEVVDVNKPVVNPVSAEVSKKNLSLARDTMAKCKTLDDMSRYWGEVKREDFTPEDFEKVCKSKEYFKSIFVNRAKQGAVNGK